jgi:hypothetical protein
LRARKPGVTIGEYGFLAPGAAASSDLASRGKIYTFRIVESATTTPIPILCAER